MLRGSSFGRVHLLPECRGLLFGRIMLVVEKAFGLFWPCSATVRFTPAILSQYGCGSKPMVPFWGRCTTHQIWSISSGDWDVHWGYGLLTHGHIVFWCSWWFPFRKKDEPPIGPVIPQLLKVVTLCRVPVRSVWSGLRLQKTEIPRWGRQPVLKSLEHD